MQRIPAWPTGIASHIIPSSCGTLDRQRVANEAPRPGGWRGAARERCLTTRTSAKGRKQRARATTIAPRHRTPSITNGEAAAGGALWADIALPDLLAS